MVATVRQHGADDRGWFRTGTSRTEKALKGVTKGRPIREGSESRQASLTFQKDGDVEKNTAGM
jgi:hypothetical protein